MNRKGEQIQERREFGKEYLYRRGRADSVIRLGSNLFAGEAFSACVSPSHVPYFIGTSELKRLCFYKKSSGYFYFFPASGYRNNSDGKLYNSGSNGYGWTSTPNGSSNAWNLNFNSGNAYMNNNNRGHGFPVRCVQASAPVFAFTKDTFCFFPAAGYRNYSDGSLRGSGTEGDGWTSTPSSSYGSYLRFLSGIAHVNDADRAFGLPVRCVQASATVFAFTNDTFVFFPASGCRDYRIGSPLDSGSRGYGWSSTVSGDNACYLYFSAGAAYIGVYYRDYGRPVRCVQASAAVWIYLVKELEQIRFRRESGKARLCRRGRADSVTRLRHKIFARESLFICVASSYSTPLIKLPVFKYLYFYKHSSGYFLFFPATGYRHYSNGSFYNSGTWGYWWTSTPGSDGKAWRLHVESQSCRVVADWCSYGFPVRCVQASASVFAFTERIPADFFPASGDRDKGDGKLYNSGWWGYGWTSTPKGSDAYGLLLHSGNASMNYYGRSYGFPVRCVQASAAVWIYLVKELKQIRFRRESGKASLCRRGRADSVTRLRHKVFASESLFICAASSYSTPLIKLPVFKYLYFYKHSSGYFFFFPASGYRTPDAWLLDSGSEGDGWSLTPAGGGAAYYLRIISGAAYVRGANGAYGFPVRCVQASAPVFAFTNDAFVFFPATGGREGADSGLVFSGTWGQGWSSSPSDVSNAWFLRFSAGVVHVYSGPRNHGLSVRCVQASAPVFAFTKETFVFFPAAGVRSYDAGSLYNMGAEGDGWTSTPDKDDCAFRFFFKSGGALLGGGTNRSYGFPVRCVQASASVWVLQKENIKQIRYRRESGKARLCRRGRADSVTHLGHKSFANEMSFVCAVPSYSISLIKLPDLKRLYFYKHSSGYFLFFPASGYRNYSDGTLRDSGKEGDGWTSTPNGSNGWYLRFLSGIAHVNSNNRGNGFPVRCVQASATVFVLFFPAAGVRRYSDGVLYNGGVEGDGWTSTPVDSSNAYRFGFNSGVANMGGGTDRMYGFPVRCVQASAAVWAIQKENVKQIRYRRESGKASLCRRGRADSVTRLEHKPEVNELFIFCVTPSHLFRLIKVLVFKRLYCYKHSSGYFFFFPAAGLRNYSDGTLRNSGGEGDGWTSTPYNSDNAYRFILNSGNANMSNTNRTYGFPVRCVQASAAVFAFTNDTFDFFPASGHRSSSVGSLYYSGSRGYVWTSVPYDSSRAYYLVFYSGGTYVDADGRADGRSVRCVQASAIVFACMVLLIKINAMENNTS